jgi:hypothetical protein
LYFTANLLTFCRLGLFQWPPVLTTLFFIS